MKTIVKRTFIPFLLITMFNFAAFAENDVPVKGETVKVTGKIIDKETGEVLTGVKILFNSSDAVYTDFDGQFELTTNVSESSEFVVSMISYKSKKVKLNDSDSFTIELERKK